MSENENEIAKRVHDMQTRGRDYGLSELPGFLEWSEKMSPAGGSEAVIDHMLVMSMYLLPEEVEKVSEIEFNEIYQEILSDIER